MFDVFARRIVGWRVAASLRTDFVLDALEQAIDDRCGAGADDLVLTASAAPSICRCAIPTGSRRPASSPPSIAVAIRTNALAESVIGLFKTEEIQRQGPWRHVEAVDFATLEWVDWFNMRWLLEPIAYVPPAEYAERYYQQAAVA